MPSSENLTENSFALSLSKGRRLPGSPFMVRLAHHERNPKLQYSIVLNHQPTSTSYYFLVYVISIIFVSFCPWWAPYMSKV